MPTQAAATGRAHTTQQQTHTPPCSPRGSVGRRSATSLLVEGAAILFRDISSLCLAMSRPGGARSPRDISAETARIAQPEHPDPEPLPAHAAKEGARSLWPSKLTANEAVATGVGQRMGGAEKPRETLAKPQVCRHFKKKHHTPRQIGYHRQCSRLCCARV